MSQKINPISFRLGILQVWNTVLTSYNNLNVLYFYKKWTLEKYIKSLFEKNNLSLSSLNWVLNTNGVFLIITYTKLSGVFNGVHTFKNKLNKILYLTFSSVPKVYLLENLTWFNSSTLLSSYISFHIKKNNNFKQTFKNLNRFLLTKLNTKKVLHTNKGPLHLKLKGFKVKSAGRFDNPKNQMSSTLQYKVGSLPMSKLNSYVEYTQTCIYTNLRVCSLHIWLIFSL